MYIPINRKDMIMQKIRMNTEFRNKILNTNQYWQFLEHLKQNKFSKDIWLLFIMAPYIFLDRDDGHFVSLNNTIKMVAEATFEYKKSN